MDEYNFLNDTKNVWEVLIDMSLHNYKSLSIPNNHSSNTRLCYQSNA